MWVNRRFAERFLSGQSALGSTIRLSSSKGTYAVAGVVGDAREGWFGRDIQPAAYIPGRKGVRYFAARTSVAPLSLAAQVKEAVRAVSPRLLVHEVADESQRLAEGHYQERLLTKASLAFGGLTLGLAAIGIYGVLSYSVVRRTGEIAIRMALGAARGDVLRLLLGEGLRVAVLGASAGLVAAYWVGRLFASFLFGVTPLDGWSYAGGDGNLAERCRACRLCSGGTGEPSRSHSGSARRMTTLPFRPVAAPGRPATSPPPHLGGSEY